jgi:4-amino-4-deoxy-L-arabinose transferase-like glycosyltransferase
MIFLKILGASIQKVLAVVREYPWLVALILLGLVMRLWGIGIGLPTTDLVGDETTSIQYILRVLATGNPFIHQVNPYPIMMSVLSAPGVLIHLAVIWIQHGMTGVDQLQTYLLLKGVNALQIWPRLISAMFGTASLIVIFKILTRLFSRPAAYLGTAGVTVSLLAIHLSHWGRPHSVMVFFILSAAYAAILCTIDGRKRYFYATYILSACALATHYLGVASFIFPIVLFWFYKPSAKEFLKALGMAAAIAVPAYLINFSGTVLMVWGAFQNYYVPNDFAGLYPVGRFERFYYIFRDLFYLDPIGVIAGALGFVALIIRRRFSKPMLVVFLGTAFMYLVQVTIVAAPHETRWLLPFNAFFLGVGLAAMADFIYSNLQPKRQFLVYLLFILLIPELLISCKWLSLLGGHTQLQVESWMREHQTERQFVYSENINPTPTSEAAAWNAEHSPRLKTSAKNLYVIAHPDQFFDSGISYFHGTELGGEDHCSIFKDLRIKYVVVRFESIKQKLSILEGIKKCLPQEPLVRFSPGPDSLLDLPFENLVNSVLTFRYVLASDRIGPWFEIYQIEGD